MKSFISLLTILWVTTLATACDYTVRDIGFVEYREPRLRLVVLFHDDLDEAQLRRAQGELNRQAAEPNCRAWNLNFQSGTLANLNDPTDAQRTWLRDSDRDWSCWLGRSDGEYRLLEEASIDHRPNWEQLLGEHLQLPLLQTFREQALDSFAQLVLFESTSTEDNEKAEQVIAQTLDALGKAASLLPRPITQPVRVIRVAASDREKYAALLWLMHSRELAADAPSLVTLYGRGRLAGPTLQGADSQVDALLGQLVLVGQACECGTQRNWVQYPNLPIAWPEELQSSIADHVGFDHRSTLIIEEVKRIIQRGPQSLPNGRDDVGDVVNSTLSLSHNGVSDELSATVIQGDGWGFELSAESSSAADADQAAPLIAIPIGHAVPEAVTEKSPAQLSNSAAEIASRGAGAQASGARASGGLSGFTLLLIATAIAIGILLCLRLYRSSSIA